MSQHGVGGMRTKLIACAFTTSYGIPTYITNDYGALLKIINGEHVGTYFVPKKKKSKLKPDILYAKIEKEFNKAWAK